MKRGYKILTALLVATSVFSLNISAQPLSGVYTINSALATSGSNFQTFNALAATINTAGVSGPVTVNVVAGSGPYIEQVQFTAITGASAINSITINGNNNVLTFAGTLAAPHTMVLNGTDFMSVNSLTVVGTGATYALVVHLWNTAENNTFTNCRMEAPIVGTGAALVPVSISGSGTSATTFGNSGNNNLFSGCTIVGGVRGVSIYGNTGIPYNFNNQVVDCSIFDFYQYGIYNYYSQYALNRNNLIQRLNRATSGTAYGIALNYGCYPARIEKNKIRRMFDGIPGATSAMYGIYIIGPAIQASVNVISNNLISDISSNGTIYGIYEAGYTYNNFYHNSIILDNATSTGGTIYGIMDYSNTGEVKNNLISINRTGSGTKTCLYFGSSITSNNNILTNTSPAGANSVGNFNGTTYASLALWQAGTMFDAASVSGNPTFNNPTLYDYTPTNLALNNAGSPAVGITTDINNLSRFTPAPDAGAFEFFNQPCSTVSGTNAVVSPTYVVCQSALNSLSLANSYSVVGLTFTWQQATNLIGPYTAINGATNTAYTTPALGANMYYNVIIGCVNGGTSVTAVAGAVMVAGTVTDTAPYFEGFENINANKDLPNCSWARSDNYQCSSRTGSVNAWRQARTGNKFGEFDASNSVYNQTRYFYSNGIWLNAGVTYSGSVWYNTPGNTTWYNLNLRVGPNQSQTGMVTLASVQNPNNSSYLPLSNIFTVATSGYYYVSVGATENGWAQQIVWDDLRIEIPCSVPNNSANVSITGPSTVCAGTAVSLNAVGAGSYSWTNGPASPMMTATPSLNSTYYVTGTNTLSGCANTVSREVMVYQLPLVSIAAFDTKICPGESTTLYALSATAYTWSAGPSFNSQVSVAPLVTTVYTVMGVDAIGCVGTATQQVTVNQLPVITVSGSTMICEGSSTTLNGLGATTYTWKADNAYLQAPVITISPASTTQYTVSGTDNATKCTGSSIIVVAVDPCLGLQNANGTTVSTSVYPNPNNGAFTVVMTDASAKVIDVVDITGRIVLSTNSATAKTEMNISSLANGVYYVKVKSDNGTEVIKVVKH